MRSRRSLGFSPRSSSALALLIERCLRAAFYEDFEFDLGWLRWRDDFTIHRYVVRFVAPCTRHILIEDWLGLLRQSGSLRFRGIIQSFLDEFLMATAAADADAFLTLRHAAATRVNSLPLH